MKKLVALIVPLAVFALMIVSCSNKPKGRLEQRFERYVQENFYNPKDFKGFSAINITDTLDVIEIGYGCVAQSDSINDMLIKAMKKMNEQLKTVTSRPMQSVIDNGIAVSLKGIDDAHGVYKRAARKERLTELLDKVVSGLSNI
ncbi:MAG: hypothetical protein NC209_03825 [Alistipes sp.]|nr:hypothetical protein [Lachnospiraceae bacterium]MCM1250260.1 hypothetical protein [Alistipes sp.]